VAAAFKAFCKCMIFVYLIAFWLWFSTVSIEGDKDFLARVVNAPVSLPPQIYEPVYEPAYEPLEEIEEEPEEYIPAVETVYINRLTALYDAVNFERVGFWTPYEAEVEDRFGESRVKIDTPYGLMWVNLDFEIPIWEIYEFMYQFGGSVSVYYENLASGFVFRHYAERVFFGASATKQPFALYIYHKAAAGNTNLNSVLNYQEGDYWGGSGVIQHRYEVGTAFTQRRLLHLMLVPSDNIATRMLRRAHGLNGFRAFVEEIGGNPGFVQNLTYSHLSAEEAGLFMRVTFEFFENGGSYADELRLNMLQNRYPFIISDHPVASKSGWAYNFGGAYHDMAIVFADSPYTLSILSNRSGTAADRRAYHEISMFFQEFNDTWFTLGGRML